MKRKTIRENCFHNMEHYQFVSHLIYLCKEANHEKLNEKLPTLEDALEKERKALNRAKKLDGSDDLKFLDKKRDGAYYALRLLVRFNLHSEDEQVLTAAKIVDEIMSRYPRPDRYNYEKETAAIGKLVADLKSEIAIDSIKKIEASKTVERLGKANAEFDKRYTIRIKTIKPVGTFNTRELRKKTNVELKKVFARIDAIDNMDPNEKISLLITHYNNLVDQYNTLFAHRNTRKKHYGCENYIPYDEENDTGRQKTHRRRRKNYPYTSFEPIPIQNSPSVHSSDAVAVQPEPSVTASAPVSAQNSSVVHSSDAVAVQPEPAITASAPISAQNSTAVHSSDTVSVQPEQIVSPSDVVSIQNDDSYRSKTQEEMRKIVESEKLSNTTAQETGSAGLQNAATGQNAGSAAENNSATTRKKMPTAKNLSRHR